MRIRIGEPGRRKSRVEQLVSVGMRPHGNETVPSENQTRRCWDDQCRRVDDAAGIVDMRITGSWIRVRLPKNSRSMRAVLSQDSGFSAETSRAVRRPTACGAYTPPRRCGARRPTSGRPRRHKPRRCRTPESELGRRSRTRPNLPPLSRSSSRRSDRASEPARPVSGDPARTRNPSNPRPDRALRRSAGLPRTPPPSGLRATRIQAPKA